MVTHWDSDCSYFIGAADEALLFDLIFPSLKKLWAEVGKARTGVV